MITMQTFKTRQDWLEARQGRIGGSDAAAILGVHPSKTNVELWEEKTGRRTAPDISDLPDVKYGTEAEEPLRELFKLDFPEFQVSYEENNMWLNDSLPWMHASLDGWLRDPFGNAGIWECKTANIRRSGQRGEWKNQIPHHYFVQLIHYFSVTRFDFAILKGQLRYAYDDRLWLQTNHYTMTQQEVRNDMEFLTEKEYQFWQQVKNDTPPNLILPEI